MTTSAKENQDVDVMGRLGVWCERSAGSKSKRTIPLFMRKSTHVEVLIGVDITPTARVPTQGEFVRVRDRIIDECCEAVGVPRSWNIGMRAVRRYAMCT